MPEVIREINVKSESGKRPLDYAVAKLVPSAVELLLRAGCDAATIYSEVLPPYLVETPVAIADLERLFAVMNLLQPTMRQWDRRWVIMRAVSDKQPGAVDQCMVCMERPPQTVALPCGHKVVCEACSAALKVDPNNRRTCIICRQPIDDVYLLQSEKMQTK
jgi:hypothetical protein